MTVEEIIKEKLDQLGADGLCNGDAMCGCSKNSLAPCMDGPNLSCVAARMIKVETMDAEQFEECGAAEYYDYGEEGEWFVQLKDSKDADEEGDDEC